MRWVVALGLVTAMAVVVLTWRDDSPTRASLASSPPSRATSPSTGGTPPNPSVTPAESPTRRIATDTGPPSLPDAALGLSVPAAEAFIRFYFGQAHNYLKATGDGAAVERWSDTACAECRRIVGFFRTRNARNKLVTGDYWYRDIRVTRFERTGTTSAETDVSMRVGRYQVLPYGHLPPGHSAGETVSATITLIARGNHWIIFDMEGRQS